MHFWSGVFSIVLIDLALAGDNAVVIGLAAARLPPQFRGAAIRWGALAAIVFRIVLTIIAAMLLGLPLLQATGGAVLVWIAYKLLRPPEDEPEMDAGVPAAEEAQGRADGMFDAVKTIVVADLVMSLDNILAIGGVARGHLVLLIFGLALSIGILMVGGSVVARLIDRFPWLTYAGSAILAWTAAHMILRDALLVPYWDRAPFLLWTAPPAITIVVLGAGCWYLRPSDRTALKKLFNRFRLR